MSKLTYSTYFACLGCLPRGPAISCTRRKAAQATQSPYLRCMANGSWLIVPKLTYSTYFACLGCVATWTCPWPRGLDVDCGHVDCVLDPR